MAKMRELWHAWMAEKNGRRTAKGNLAKPDVVTVVLWVKQVWDSIPCEMVARSFLKRSISNKLDGTKDDLLFDESDRSEEEENEADWCTDIKITPENVKEMFGDSDSYEEFEGF